MAKRPAPKPARAREVEVQLPPSAAPSTPAPIPLEGVIGQERAKVVMREALASGRVHHAWIFQGPRGVGKRTAALAFAALLLDPTSAPGLTGEWQVDPDGQVARLLRAGSHPDLVVITRDTAAFHEDRRIRDQKRQSIPVQVVRDFVIEPARLAPAARTESRAGRVFVIDHADLLNLAAQNALLKLLEEPPPGTVFLLVTDAPDELLPTVRSRCQRVSFTRLDQRDMRAWIDAASRERGPDGEGPSPTRGEAEFLASFCGGSPGDFQHARAAGLHRWWERLSPLLSQTLRGTHVVELAPAMLELIDERAAADVKEQGDAGSKDAANKDACAWMIRLLAWAIAAPMRDAPARGQASGDQGAIGRALGMIDALRTAELELDSNVNMLMVLEKLSASLAEQGGPLQAASR